MIALDLEGLAVSAGSACSSGKVSASHVIKAMGFSDAAARSAIRVSFGWATTAADLDQFTDVWSRLLARSRTVRREPVAAELEAMAVTTTLEKVKSLEAEKYKYGFVTDIESDKAPKGLSEETVRYISAKKGEPAWLLDWRLEAYRRWRAMTEPTWARVHYPRIDFDDAYYYSAPKGQKDRPQSLDEVSPELLRTYEKLGIPLSEQKILAGVAVDAVFDSVSVATTFRAKLAEVGVIFCPISEAVREHPELVRKYLGSVVPPTDNFYATLNSAVYFRRSFVYIPPGVRCPKELSTYFRINERNTGRSSARSSSPTRALTSPISRAARRRCATKTSSTPRSSS